MRFAAAEGLWKLGHRDGFQALVELLDVRPVESGGEGGTVGEGSLLKVTASRGTNVEIIRSACKVLGEMGDRSAAEALKTLLPLNLNGVLGGGSGTGWMGRPDAVALAKLGDFSGIAVLRASIDGGDRLDIASSGNFVEIGLKRLIPELLPLLEHDNDRKRVLAAREILLLLERGK